MTWLNWMSELNWMTLILSTENFCELFSDSSTRATVSKLHRLANGIDRSVRVKRLI